MKVLYFYISNNFEGFQSFNIHIKELIENANTLEDVEFIGYRPLATSNEKQATTTSLYSKVKRYIPRFGKDLLALWANVSEYRYAVNKVKEVQPDVILFRHNFMNMYQIFLKRKFNIPIMLEVNSPISDERREQKNISLYKLSKFVETLSWKKADKIHVVSNALKQRLAQYVDSNKIISIHNGGNPSYYKHLVKTESDKIRIGYVGSFQKYHGIDILFNTIPTLLDKYDNIEFYLIGKGGLYDEYKAFFDNQPQYKERVILRGFVDFEKIPEEINTFDIATMMDFTEYGSPLKLFEYMLAKCCIILPDRETIHEVMEDGKDTLLFEPRNGEDFSRLLSIVIENDNLRKKMAEKAYNKVISQYTWKHNAEKVVKELRTLLELRNT